MPTPCPQPRPLTRKLVAVTSFGCSVWTAVSGRAEAAPARASAPPMRAKSVRSMVWTRRLRLAQALGSTRDSLPKVDVERGVSSTGAEGRAVPVQSGESGRRGVLPPRYRDPEQIARGGMGVIYRAEDGLLGRTVAVKVLADPYADDEGIRRRFTHEALAAARLSNAPSTITIFDVGEHEGHPYIVMEYLAGGSIADRLTAEGAQPTGRALAWLAQAAAALDAGHAQGVVHRDVKPANLLLDDDDQVRVADFGVASAAGLDSFTAAGTVLGTAGYLAPEQARGERADPSSDRYALAVVAFELLTGSRPFERESAAAEAAAHVNAPAPSAVARNPDLPRELEGVFARGLAKEPTGRHESCAELVDALRAAFDAAAGGTVVHRPQSRSRLPLALGLLAAAAVALAGVA